VATVVGEQRKGVVQGGGSNEQVEVADKGPCGSEAAAFSSEVFGYRRIETKQRHPTKNVGEVLLIAFWIV
jgi:hypothetical protein